MFENKYPYTDFHELNLDWFLAEFKKVHDQVDTLDATVKEFTEFVTNYFDNLDLQEQVNIKLNEMAADGSLSALIQPLFDEYKTEINNIVSVQNNTLQTQSNQIDVLESRMDSFAHLAEGSTTGDAELMDIRIGIDGYEYPSAGDAVRGQISAIVERSNQLFNFQTMETYNGFDMTGTVQANNDCRSVIIPVNPSADDSYITLHRELLLSRFAVATFTAKPDTGSTSVNHVVANSAHSAKIPVDTTIKYLLVFLWRVDDLPNSLNDVAEDLMVQYGNAYTGYEPFYAARLFNGQITENELSHDINVAIKSEEINKIINNNNINLWDTSMFTVMEDTRCSGYNVSTYEITTASDPGYSTTVVDIPKNVDIIKIDVPSEIPNGGQVYVAISSTLRISTNRPFSALNASFKDQYAYYNYGDGYFTLDLYQMRAAGFEKIAISTYKNASMYINTDQVYSKWLTSVPDIYSPIGAFGSIGAVGDSYTAASVVKADSSWVDMTDFSYVAVMAKRAGISWSNYGKGGTNTRTYITSKLNDVLTAPANDLYFLALGINDSSLGSAYIGSVSDIHVDYHDNPDTFYGNYGRIIDQIKTHAPNARFCMIKTPIYLTLKKEIDAAIEEIAEHYGFACIDPLDDYFFRSKTFNTRVSNHPSCIGYAGMAMAYERLLSKAIDENPNYFFYSNIDSNIPS